MAIGQHYQNAYVTRNVDKAVEGFRKWADTRLILETAVEVKLWTPEGEGVGIQKLAFVWIDDLNYELIEPKSGDVLKIYKDALPEGDELVLHHVCHRGTPDMLQFCYVDTREWLGHFTEYIWANPERWRQLGGR
mgnify:CR=1 FL=1